MSTSTRVLVIDDHAIVRAGICAALEKREDFAIFQAASKSEALAQMAKLNPDVIVVDDAGVLASQFVGFVAGTSTLLISNCPPLMSVA